jgi:hypothetical protein
LVSVVALENEKAASMKKKKNAARAPARLARPPARERLDGRGDRPVRGVRRE